MTDQETQATLGTEEWHRHTTRMLRDAVAWLEGEYNELHEMPFHIHQARAAILGAIHRIETHMDAIKQ